MDLVVKKYRARSRLSASIKQEQVFTWKRLWFSVIQHFLINRGIWHSNTSSHWYFHLVVAYMSYMLSWEEREQFCCYAMCFTLERMHTWHSAIRLHTSLYTALDNIAKNYILKKQFKIPCHFLLHLLSYAFWKKSAIKICLLLSYVVRKEVSKKSK